MSVHQHRRRCCRSVRTGTGVINRSTLIRARNSRQESVHEKDSVIFDVPPVPIEDRPRARDAHLDWALSKLKAWIAALEDRSRVCDQISGNRRPYLRTQWHGCDSADRDDQFVSTQDRQAKATAVRPCQV